MHHFADPATEPLTDPSLMPRKSTLCRAWQAARLVREHYEPGNYSRSLRQVWRKWALPAMGVGYRTFLRYLTLAAHWPEPVQPQRGQN